MPRAEVQYKTEAVKQAVAPVILLRVLDIPDVSDPSITQSLYLTDCEENLSFFDEHDEPQTYTSCSLKVEYAEVSKENKISQCRVLITNVYGEFSALAQTCRLNGVMVEVLRAFRDNLSVPEAAQTMFAGKIKAVVLGETYIDATITAGMGISVKVPRRLYWPSLFPYLPSAKDLRDPYYADE